MAARPQVDGGSAETTQDKSEASDLEAPQGDDGTVAAADTPDATPEDSASGDADAPACDASTGEVPAGETVTETAETPAEEVPATATESDETAPEQAAADAEPVAERADDVDHSDAEPDVDTVVAGADEADTADADTVVTAVADTGSDADTVVTAAEDTTSDADTVVIAAEDTTSDADTVVISTDATDTIATDEQAPAVPRSGGLAALWPPRAPTTRTGWIAAASIILVLALAIGGVVWWRAGVLPEGVAYAVGDQNVTVKELDGEVETLRALYGLTPPTDEPGLAKFRRDLAQASSVGLVIDKAGAERGVVISDKVAQDTLTRYVEEFFGGGTNARDQFVRALGTAGTSEPSVLTEIKRQLLIRQLFGDVTKDVKPTEDEVRKVFDERQADLAVPERRELSNIVVTSREQADQVAAELAGGADFAVLAAARSADQSTKDQGGKLGAIAATQLEPGYADVAFSAPQGGIFGPVETRYGWNVGKVAAILPPQAAVYERIVEPLRQQVGLEKATGVWRDWLQEQISSADVRYAEAYQPENPGALPSESLPGAPGASPGSPAPPK